MFQIGILHRFRRLSAVQQQSIRTIQVAIRPVVHSNGNVCRTRAAIQSWQDHKVHAIGRSFLNTHAKKPQLLFTVRGFISSPVKPEDGELIYKGNLGTAIRGVKLFSYSTTVISLSIMQYVPMDTVIGMSSLPLQVAFAGLVCFFAFLSPVLLHIMTKGYILRLYHNKDTDMYTAITLNPMVMEKRMVFHQSDVVVPEVSGMFTSFYAKKYSMLVNPLRFDLPQDYNHLMGYDRPFNFDFDDVSKPEKEK